MCFSIGDKTLNILIGFEYSGVLRDKIVEQTNYNVISCDLLPGEGIHTNKHYQGNIFDLTSKNKYDLAILFPPCTHLAVSGNRWRKEK